MVGRSARGIASCTMSAYDLVDKAKDSGLGLVQIADNLPLEGMTDNELSDLAVYAAGNGVAIEMGSRGLTLEHTVRCLETAEKLNSPILRMVIDRPGYEPDLKTIIDNIKQLIPELRSKEHMTCN